MVFVKEPFLKDNLDRVTFLNIPTRQIVDTAGPVMPVVSSPIALALSRKPL